MTTEEITNSKPIKQLLAEGMNAANSGDHSKALALLTAVIKIDPSHATAHNEMGVNLYNNGAINEAQASFQRAVDLQPEFARALTNLGACFNEEKNNGKAIECYKKALKIQPEMADAWGNLAKAWTESEEFEMAVYCYQKTIELTPKGEFDRGIAKAYRKSGRYERSEQALNEAIRKNPDDHDAHFGLALTLFYLEKYPQAIAEFEWRRKINEMEQHRKDLYPIFDGIEYCGQDLSDKTLLLHTEQGFGDNLQFARFIALVRPRVKNLVMWCRPGLGSLFKHSFDLDAVSENVFKLPDFDYQLPLLSVPFHFDPALNSLKNNSPYLIPPKDSIVLPKLSTKKLSVGFVWGASDSGFDHSNKKVPLNIFKSLFSIDGVQWYSLQVGSDRNDIATDGFDQHVIDLGDSLVDFAKTASAIAQLDMVISCDTSVAHLAGAMGKPVWLMLKKNPDWRWHSDGESTIWYPSARMYRQDSHGSWSSVIRRIHRDLCTQADIH